MTAFERLTQTAVIGTQQNASAVTFGDAEADALVARDGESAERALLRAAAIAATVRRATATAPVFEIGANGAPEEVLARCGPIAASDLAAALVTRDAAGEWLSTARHFGIRVREEQLPALLEFGLRAPSHRDAILAVIGGRGRWLAGENDAWAYARGDGAEFEQFDESGDRAVRVAVLRRMREADAAAARAALEATWAKEAAGDRASLLEALGTGLSLEDEPFLERAREDSRKDVRGAANVLLHRLPQSQAARRAIELAAPLLSLKRGLLGREFVVRLPEAFSAGMRAEGLEAKPPHGIGERAFWLRQLLANVPVDHWLAAFDVDFAKLCEIARKNEFAVDLLDGFVGALDGYRDRSNRAKLVALAARDDYYVDWELRTRVRLHPHESGEAPFLEALRTKQPRAASLLAHAPHGWSVALSVAALAAARNGLERAGGDWQEFQNRASLFALLARSVDPRTPGVEADWPQSYANEKTRGLVEELLDRLRFRSDIYTHLKDNV